MEGMLVKVQESNDVVFLFEDKLAGTHPVKAQAPLESIDFPCFQTKLKKKVAQTAETTAEKTQRLFKYALEDICAKYFITMNEEEERICLQYAFQLKHINCGINEAAAAMVFYLYSDSIRFNKLKLFAVRNQLNARLFNRHYKIIHNAHKVKNYKNGSLSSSSKYNQEFQNESQENPSENVNFLQSISFIYDHLFTKPYFQQNRREIIQKLAARVESHQRLINEMSWNQSPMAKMYYILYYLIKECGYFNFGFKFFSEIVHEKVGVQLSKTHALTAHQLWKKNMAIQDQDQEERHNFEALETQDSF